MTAESWSTLTAHFASNVPLANQVKSSVVRGVPSYCRNTIHDSTNDTSIRPLVIHIAGRSPRRRLPRPAISAPSSVRVTIATSIERLPLHHVEVFDGDGAAIAEIDHQNGTHDRRLRRGDGEDEHGEHLPHHVVEEAGEGHQVDVDREQD